MAFNMEYLKPLKIAYFPQKRGETYQTNIQTHKTNKLTIVHKTKPEKQD